MTPDEFATKFLPELAATFPEVAKWIAEHKTVLAGWQRALSGFSVADVCRVLQSWLENGAPFRMFASEWQEIPRHIRQACRVACTPESQLQPMRFAPIDRKSLFGTIGHEIISLAERFKSGAIEREPYEERKAELLAEFASQDKEENERDAVYCRQCNDGGFVRCWGWDTVIAVRDGFEYIPHYELVVHCTCKRSWERYPGKKDATPVTYNQRSFCRYDTGDAKRDIGAWLEWRQGDGIKQHANYETEFADF
jgi:hypothetical protein